MSKLKDLCARIEKLPGLRDTAAIEGRLARFVSTLEKASADIETFEEAASCAEAVFGESHFRKLRQQRSGSSANARQLRDALATDLNAAGAQKTQDVLASIARSATSVREGLGQTWALLIQEEYNQYQAVASWVSEFQKSDKVKARLDRIVGQKNKLPRTRPAAEQVSNDIEFVRDSFKTMGLEGKVKEFVEKALAGEAPAELLKHQDVKHFIDETNLWKFLKVRLGNEC
jgi:hypothetical protein